MLIAAATTGSTTGSTSAGSQYSFFFFLILAFGVMWLLVIRPRQRKQKLQTSMQSELSVGDEILTAGGVYGKVTRVGDEEVHVEIAPNVEVRLARRAIAAQLTEHELPTDPEDASDDPWKSSFDAESGEEKPG